MFLDNTMKENTTSGVHNVMAVQCIWDFFFKWEGKSYFHKSVDLCTVDRALDVVG